MNPTPQTISNSSIFILGALINSLALLDVSGLTDYALKGIVGGFIWLGFKILADYISERLQKNKPQPKDDSDTMKK